jgi:hypothetical protein
MCDKYELILSFKDTSSKYVLLILGTMDSDEDIDCMDNCLDVMFLFFYCRVYIPLFYRIWLIKDTYYWTLSSCD